MRNYIEITKPRVTWLILMSTAVGYYFGVQGAWRAAVLLHTLLGTGLLASGTATLNEWYEREADARMRRTRNRPLPSGRMKPGRALAWGIFLSAAGFLELFFAVNPLAAWCGLFTLAAYLFLYTPLKQRTSLAGALGTLPGAMPPLIGYAASRGALTAQAWVLFVILLLWQFPHFLAIAWLYREDYKRAGIRMLPVVAPDGRSTARQMVICSALLIPASLAPAYTQMTGRLYLFGALALGTAFLYTAVRVAFERSTAGARRVLLASVVYLPLLYGMMLLDRPAL